MLESTKEVYRTTESMVDEFIDSILSPDLKAHMDKKELMEKANYDEWMTSLNVNEWTYASWPKEYGGKGWDLRQRFVFEDILARKGLPWILPFGVKYVGPVIYTFGNEDQKRKFLPGIRDNSEYWAQGYSEPNAGSDLASLKTTAVDNGDHYIVNGQKVWTTYAQWADWLFCLVKTDTKVKSQNGISFILIDMKSPGITVTPIHTMDGYIHVNEVWLEDVRVPKSNLVGEEGKGWTYAKFLLKNERTNGMMVGQAFRALKELRVLIENIFGENKKCWPIRIQNNYDELNRRFLAVESLSYMILDQIVQGQEDGSEASIIKIRATELLQDTLTYHSHIAGVQGVSFDKPEVSNDEQASRSSNGKLREHLYNRASTIFGGATEVQKDIIARTLFGA